MPEPGKPFTETLPEFLAAYDLVPFTAPDGRLLWIGKTEVPWEFYDPFALQSDLPESERRFAKGESDAISRPSRPYGAPDHGFGHQGYPALSMTFLSAQKFCLWLSEKTGKRYRLPTEAEWEKAAGPAPDDFDTVAWFWDNADDKTHPIGKKQPNSLGLYDVFGNAAEWCVAEDGTPVVRGGSYNDTKKNIGPDARQTQQPSWNQTDPQNPKSRWWLADGYFLGMRLVCEGPMPKTTTAQEKKQP